MKSKIQYYAMSAGIVLILSVTAVGLPAGSDTRGHDGSGPQGEVVLDQQRALDARNEAQRERADLRKSENSIAVDVYAAVRELYRSFHARQGVAESQQKLTELLRWAVEQPGLSQKRQRVYRGLLANVAAFSAMDREKREDLVQEMLLAAKANLPRKRPPSVKQGTKSPPVQLKGLFETSPEPTHTPTPE